MSMCWTEDVALDELLAAAGRAVRSRAGQEIPAWGEPSSESVGSVPDDSVPDDPVPDESVPDDSVPDDPVPDESVADDPLGDGELPADESAAAPALQTPELAGQMRIPPGASLAAWLGQTEPAALDDAGLVNSIAGWRKITSWAQAQELAAVAEVARRRGATDDPSLDRDPARKLEAEFAPNEIALALTMTQFAAEYWVSLAVSLSGRLPGTLSALRSGLIDLNRARLIDQYTTPLDDDLAQAVERKVLPRAPRQTTTQLAASLRRAVMSVDPAAAERRRKAAERHARVELTGDDAGTAALYGRLLPAAQAAAAWARISAMADRLQGRGAGGGIDLIRAQVFIGLLLGTLPVPPDVPGPSDPGHPGPPQPPDPSRPPGDSRGGADRNGAPGGCGSRSGPGTGPVNDREPQNGPEPASEPESAGVGRLGAAGTGTSGAGAAGTGTSGAGAAGTGTSGAGAAGGAGKHPRGLGSDPTDQAPTAGNPGLDGVPWCWPHIPGPGEVPGFGGPAAGIHGGRSTLTVPWRSLAGLSSEPGQLTRIGAITAETARELSLPAAADPACEWRILITDAAGQLLAVTRIRSPGGRRASPPHPRQRRGGLSRITVTVPVTILGQPPPRMAATRFAGGAGLATALQTALDDALSAARKAVHAKGTNGLTGPGAACRHEDAAASYRIPGRLRALVEARDQHCRYPICRRPAAQCDLDHTVPYDQGGLTCRCNLSGGCRRHHRMKTLTSWRLRQPQPGTLIWTAPSRLAWTTSPETHPV
jgi:Domain of unknown function (DUF222)